MVTRHCAHRANLAATDAAQKNESHGLTAVAIEAKTIGNEHPNSAASGADCKAFSTLRARLAIRGVALQQLPSGGYFVRSWGVGRVLADLPAVATFAEKVGA